MGIQKDIKQFIGDKGWLAEAGRPDDTDMRAAIELLEEAYRQIDLLTYGLIKEKTEVNRLSAVRILKGGE